MPWALDASLTGGVVGVDNEGSLLSQTVTRLEVALAVLGGHTSLQAKVEVRAESGSRKK